MLLKKEGILDAMIFNPLSANPTKWSNTLKQFVGIFSANCLSVFDHFVRLALKGLKANHQGECKNESEIRIQISKVI